MGQSKLIVLGVHTDGAYCKLITVDHDFDLQGWAESRRESFRLLNIVRLETMEV